MKISLEIQGKSLATLLGEVLVHQVVISRLVEVRVEDLQTQRGLVVYHEQTGLLLSKELDESRDVDFKCEEVKEMVFGLDEENEIHLINNCLVPSERFVVHYHSLWIRLLLFIIDIMITLLRVLIILAGGIRMRLLITEVIVLKRQILQLLQLKLRDALHHNVNAIEDDIISVSLGLNDQIGLVEVHLDQLFDSVNMSELLHLVEEIDVDDGEDIGCRVFLEHEQGGVGVDPHLDVGLDEAVFDLFDVHESIFDIEVVDI